MPQSPFAYESNGAVIVCSDGHEVLVHDGGDERPLWRHSMPGRVVDVAATPTFVVALDELGHFAYWVNGDGSPGSMAPGDVPVHQRAVAASGRALAQANRASLAVAVVDEGVIAFGWQDSGAGPRTLYLGSAHSVAIAADDSLVAIGVDQGLVVVGLQDGVVRQQISLPGTVGSVCWCREGRGGVWLVTVGAALYRVDSTGAASLVLRHPSGETLHAVAASADGALAAVRVGHHVATVITLAQGQVAAEYDYARAVGELSFGPDRWLGIGLSGGDGNKVNLVTGAVHRTDTHPGRQHNSWTLSMSRDERLLQAAGNGAAPAGAAPAGIVAAPIPAGLAGNGMRPPAGGVAAAFAAKPQARGGRGAGAGRTRKKKPAWLHALWISLLVLGLGGAIAMRFALRQTSADDADRAALQKRISESIRRSMNKSGLGSTPARKPSASAATDDTPASKRDRVVGDPNEW